MSWNEFFGIAEKIKNYRINSICHKIDNYYLLIDSNTDYSFSSVKDNNEKTIQSITINRLGHISYFSKKFQTAILDYKQYTDDIETTLILGRVPDYSITKYVLERYDELG